MYLLYLDDSGSVKNPNETHLFLAGLAVFERQPYWLSQQLDQIAARLWPEDPHALEFHSTEIFSGKRHWRGLEKSVRLDAFKEALALLSATHRISLFGAAIHKASVSPEDPLEYAFEQICNRFDRYLVRLHRKNRDTQRGLIVLDESAYETSLQALAREFRQNGHRWGQLRNLIEVPLFVNSKATRMIQFADMVAYARRRYYVNGDATYFDIISDLFDREGRVVHGLVHRVPTDANCNCAACRQRRS